MNKTKTREQVAKAWRELDQVLQALDDNKAQAAQSSLTQAWAAIRKASEYMNAPAKPTEQPWYHYAGIRFTGTRPFTRQELEEILDTKVRHADIVKFSLEVEAIDEPEPGDPADL